MAGPNPHAELWALIDTMTPEAAETLVLRLKKHTPTALTKLSDLVEAAALRVSPETAIDLAIARINQQPAKA